MRACSREQRRRGRETERRETRDHARSAIQRVYSGNARTSQDWKHIRAITPSRSQIGSLSVAGSSVIEIRGAIPSEIRSSLPRISHSPQPHTLITQPHPCLVAFLFPQRKRGTRSWASALKSAATLSSRPTPTTPAVLAKAQRNLFALPALLAGFSPLSSSFLLPSSNTPASSRPPCPSADRSPPMPLSCRSTGTLSRAHPL